MSELVDVQHTISAQHMMATISISISQHSLLLCTKLFCMSPRVPAPHHAFPPPPVCLCRPRFCDQTTKYTRMFKDAALRVK